MNKILDPLEVILSEHSIRIPAMLKARENKKDFISSSVTGRHGEGLCRKCKGSLVHVGRENDHKILECEVCGNKEWIYF